MSKCDFDKVEKTNTSVELLLILQYIYDEAFYAEEDFTEDFNSHQQTLVWDQKKMIRFQF